MTHDVLREVSCPHCGAGALGAESERVGVLTQYGMCEHLDWWNLNTWLVRCGLCQFVFPIVAQAMVTTEAEVVAATGATS